MSFNKVRLLHLNTLSPKQLLHPSRPKQRNTSFRALSAAIRQKSTMASTIHKVAVSGFGTGTNELYDRVRPSYQAHVFAYLRESVHAAKPLNIVEIGSGTGIFTRAFLAAPSWKLSINEIRAFEPSEGMRTQFSKTVDDPRVTLSDGAFDHLPGVPDEWADLLIIAQAFHWCPDHATALAEFARVLKPGSSVALVWNLEDRDSARWVAQLRDTIEQHEGGTPQFRLELWRKAFEEPIYKQRFEPPEEKNWPYTIPATVESVVDRASSKSYISILPEDKLSQVHADLREILKRGDDLTWTDMEKGVFEYPYKSYMVICRKRGE